MFKMDEKFMNVLRKIVKKLNESKIEWVLIGSTNQYLQGMNKLPSDIDIGVRSENFKLVKNLFKDLNKKEYEYERFEFNLDGVSVDISNPYEGVYFDLLGDKDFVSIDWEGIDIPCFPLAVEAECYENASRHERVIKIKEFLRE